MAVVKGDDNEDFDLGGVRSTESQLVEGSRNKRFRARNIELGGGGAGRAGGQSAHGDTITPNLKPWYIVAFKWVLRVVIGKGVWPVLVRVLAVVAVALLAKYGGWTFLNH